MMKKIWMAVVCAVMFFCSATALPVLANESYDAGYKQGYTDAGNDVDQPIHDADEDYLAGYDDGQTKWHEEHDKSLSQRYEEAKDAVQTTEQAVDTAQQWKGRLDNWASQDTQKNN